MPNRTRHALPVVAVALLVMLVAGCSSSHPAVVRPDVATTTTRVETERCDTAGPAATVRHLESKNGSVWVWIESATRSSFSVGSLIKVVWRITGSGAPRLAVTNPEGDNAHPAFGPELHTQSTFHHPGSEYGTGFTPTAPGCWRMTLRRGAVAGSLSLRVSRAAV